MMIIGGTSSGRYPTADNYPGGKAWEGIGDFPAARGFYDRNTLGWPGLSVGGKIPTTVFLIFVYKRRREMGEFEPLYRPAAHIIINKPPLEAWESAIVQEVTPGSGSIGMSREDGIDRALENGRNSISKRGRVFFTRDNGTKIFSAMTGTHKRLTYATPEI
ncbi:hypothetical protein EDD18DRAFT_1384187 [Armillaria luteobubalina]|uniref:Uncharacterized protein n=1 Tax=Armillaria luteobubalina TaxID=153913 RepID=A0AA39Q7D0_9AGAR|nr:hypothetical protein EDD18DRAFT_1384187 [Armillaria luteobubalina]